MQDTKESVMIGCRVSPTFRRQLAELEKQTGRTASQIIRHGLELEIRRTEAAESRDLETVPR